MCPCFKKNSTVCKMKGLMMFIFWLWCIAVPRREGERQVGVNSEWSIWRCKLTQDMCQGELCAVRMRPLDGLIFFVAKKKSKIWARALRYNAKINANFCLVISYFFLKVAKASYYCKPGNITFSVSAERCVVRWVIVLGGVCCLGCTVLAEKTANILNIKLRSYITLIWLMFFIHVQQDA